MLHSFSDSTTLELSYFGNYFSLVTFTFIVRLKKTSFHLMIPSGLIPEMAISVYRGVRYYFIA